MRCNPAIFRWHVTSSFISADKHETGLWNFANVKSVCPIMSTQTGLHLHWQLWYEAIHSTNKSSTYLYGPHTLRFTSPCLWWPRIWWISLSSLQWYPVPGINDKHYWYNEYLFIQSKNELFFILVIWGWQKMIFLIQIFHFRNVGFRN